MAESRLPRELDTREQASRPKQWQPATVLPEPDKQAGYAYRWVRVSTKGENDPRNISAALREGWEPVRIEEQQQFRMMVDPDSRFKDNVEVAGLLLCKVPEEFMAQRRAHFAEMTRAQIESVDNNFMKNDDVRMPLFREKRTTTSFGNGR